MGDSLPLSAADRFIARLVYRQAKGGMRGRVAVHVMRLLGTDIRPRKVGPGLRLPHSTVGATVHPNTELGADVILMQGVTLGRADIWNTDAPGTRVVVGDGVVIGANAVCLVQGGQTRTIGDRALIGAGAVVTQDVPAGEVWVGNPARRSRDRG